MSQNNTVIDCLVLQKIKYGNPINNIKLESPGNIGILLNQIKYERLVTTKI